jgi:acyl dehydratase
MPAPPTPPYYLDDLKPGDRYVTHAETITADEIKAFAEKFDPQPFHTDDEAAKSTFFGGLAASGWHTAALTMRLLVTSGLPLAHGIIGGGGELAWPRPTRPGDVLHVETTVLEVTPSRSRPDRGMVTTENLTKTAEGDIVQRFVAKLVVPRRLTGAFSV